MHDLSLFPISFYKPDISSLTCDTEGCTLTSSTDHGVKFCDMEIVRKDFAERNIVIRRGMTDDQLRTKLELVYIGVTHVLLKAPPMQRISWSWIVQF